MGIQNEKSVKKAHIASLNNCCKHCKRINRKLNVFTADTSPYEKKSFQVHKSSKYRLGYRQ